MDTRWATWVLCLRGNVVHVVALVAAVRRLSRQLLFADLLPAGMTRDDERSIWCLGQANPQTFYLFTFKTRSCLTSKSFCRPFFDPPLTKFAPKLPSAQLLEAFSRWLRSLGAAAVVVGPVLGGTRGWRWSCSGYQTPETTTVAGQHISGSRWDSQFSCTNRGLKVGNRSKYRYVANQLRVQEGGGMWPCSLFQLHVGSGMWIHFVQRIAQLEVIPTVNSHDLVACVFWKSVTAFDAQDLSMWLGACNLKSQGNSVASTRLRPQKRCNTKIHQKFHIYVSICGCLRPFEHVTERSGVVSCPLEHSGKKLPREFSWPQGEKDPRSSIE